MIFGTIFWGSWTPPNLRQTSRQIPKPAETFQNLPKPAKRWQQNTSWKVRRLNGVTHLELGSFGSPYRIQNPSRPENTPPNTLPSRKYRQNTKSTLWLLYFCLYFGAWNSTFLYFCLYLGLGMVCRVLERLCSLRELHDLESWVDSMLCNLRGSEGSACARHNPPRGTLRMFFWISERFSEASTEGSTRFFELFPRVTICLWP